MARPGSSSQPLSAWPALALLLSHCRRGPPWLFFLAIVGVARPGPSLPSAAARGPLVLRRRPWSALALPRQHWRPKVFRILCWCPRLAVALRGHLRRPKVFRILCWSPRLAMALRGHLRRPKTLRILRRRPRLTVALRGHLRRPKALRVLRWCPLLYVAIVGGLRLSLPFARIRGSPCPPSTPVACRGSTCHRRQPKALPALRRHMRLPYSIPSRINAYYWLATLHLRRRPQADMVGRWLRPISCSRPGCLAPRYCHYSKVKLESHSSPWCLARTRLLDRFQRACFFTFPKVAQSPPSSEKLPVHTSLFPNCALSFQESLAYRAPRVAVLKNSPPCWECFTSPIVWSGT